MSFTPSIRGLEAQLLCPFTNRTYGSLAQVGQLSRANCGHMFSTKSISQWLTKHTTCPVCHEKINKLNHGVYLIYDVAQRQLNIPSHEIQETKTYVLRAPSVPSPQSPEIWRRISRVSKLMLALGLLTFGGAVVGTVIGSQNCENPFQTPCSLHPVVPIIGIGTITESLLGGVLLIGTFGYFLTHRTHVHTPTAQTPSPV